MQELWMALAPLLLLAVAFVAYCWWDIAHSEVQHLPRWAWAIVVAVSIPVGGIVYLLLGRRDR